MNLDQAVKVLGKIAIPIKTRGDYTKHQAVLLGIEALKRIQAIRITDRVERITRLPGETEE